MIANKRKLNNSGASVIELLIVIAIIAVLISGSIIAFSVLGSSALKQASRTSKDYLEKTRTNAMSVAADEWNYTLKRSGDEYIAYIHKIYKNESDEVVTDVMSEKNLGVKVAASLISGDVTVDMADGDILKVVFEPSSGSVKAVTLNGTSYTPAENMISIKFTSGERKSIVDLYYMTGKTEIK